MTKEQELVLIQKMEKSKEILAKLGGLSEVSFSPPLNLTSTTRRYRIHKITVEPGQHIIAHYEGGRKLSINNCALWQMDRVLERLEEDL